MLPPGHIAGGYVVSLAVLRLFGVTAQGSEGFLIFGVIAAIAPDFDFIFAFLKTRSFTIDNTRANHRRYYTHRPFVWIAIALPIILNAGSESVRLVGALLLAGTMTHFVLDSIQYGVMWLWPFSYNLYALRDAGKNIHVAERRFLPFWKKFLRAYCKTFRIAAVTEGALILSALALMIARMR